MPHEELVPGLDLLRRMVEDALALLPSPASPIPKFARLAAWEPMYVTLKLWRGMAFVDLGDPEIEKGVARRLQSGTDSPMEAALSVFEQVIEALQGIDLISRADWSNLVDGLILTGSIYAHELFDAYTHEGAIDDGIGHRVLKDTVLRDLLHFVNQMGAAKDFSQIDEAKQKAIEAATTAEAAAQSSRRAAGEAGSLNLAEHFDAYRKSERRAAEILRASAVVLVIVTVVILTRLPHTGLTLADVLQRALIAVPAFGLAGYLAAESGRHRRASQWAATLKVQLLTVDAYVQPLGPEAAAEIRQLLAKRAFEDLPAAAGGAKDKEEQPLQIGTQAIVEKFIDGLKPNPDK